MLSSFLWYLRGAMTQSREFEVILTRWGTIINRSGYYVQKVEASTTKTEVHVQYLQRQSCQSVSTSQVIIYYIYILVLDRFASKAKPTILYNTQQPFSSTASTLGLIPIMAPIGCGAMIRFVLSPWPGASHHEKQPWKLGTCSVFRIYYRKTIIQNP
jgi:hypothetical protein